MRRYAQAMDRAKTTTPEGRLNVLLLMLGLLGIAIIIRLGYLQIYQRKTYALLASDQHDLQAKLMPTRGRILVRDPADGQLAPLAANKDAWTVYAVPKEIHDAAAVAKQLSPVLAKPEFELLPHLNKPDDPYEPLVKNASTETIDKLRSLNLEGIGYVKMSARLYPEKGVSGQLIGFVVNDDNTLKGRYGIEGGFNALLGGTPGELSAEKDASGGRLPFSDARVQEAVNGSDIVLTIDRTVQFEACSRIAAAVAKHGADSGSIVVMNPLTGAIIAMCSSPDFDPSAYGDVKDLSVLNNPVVFSAYEPGSIFKAMTMAAGVDAGKIGPKTTYVDKGFEKIDDFTIKNSDGVAHGVQTMTQVLDESLNTGTIFVQRQLSREAFRGYMEAFGFGRKTGIELTPEGKGDVASLSRKGSIFAATASFGQGLTVTPIQMLAAYGALANGGKLMRPHIVAEVIRPDGTHEKTKPQELGRPVSELTARVVSGMLVSVVENGHGKRAGVPGYWVAGKTGTAQVPRTDGPGYQKDVTIGSFAGYAPANDPKFVMLVKLDHPRDVQWAESSAAPLFGDMAKFLLTYYHVPTERALPPEPKVPAPVPVAPIASSTGSM